MGEFGSRMLFITLLCLVAHCAVAYAQGARGKELFGIGKPERAKTLLLAGVVVVGAAFATCPKKNKAPVAGTAVPPNESEGKVPDKVSKPDESVRPVVEPPQPVEPPPIIVPTPPVVEPPRPVIVPPRPAVRPSSVAMPQSVATPRKAVVPTGAARPRTPVPSTDPPTVDAQAEQMWNAARKIGHNYIPRQKTDRHYLSLVHGAAMAGHLEAQAKLGEYAFRRGRMVEAYYWMKLAQLNGKLGLEVRMRECSMRWTVGGCHSERGNVYELFTGRQSAIGRAALRIDSGVQIEKALARLNEMASEGEPVAIRILNQRGLRPTVKTKKRQNP